jgi:hypothetical protein
VNTNLPDSSLSAGETAVVLTGQVFTGTDVYGSLRIPVDQPGGRSILAASGETIIVLRDSVAVLFGDGCTFTGLAYLFKD